MRGVRSLSGLAGPGASLAQAGGSTAKLELTSSWIYEGDADFAPDVDLSALDWQKGDLMIVAISTAVSGTHSVSNGFTSLNYAASSSSGLGIFYKIMSGEETVVSPNIPAGVSQVFACVFSFGVPTQISYTRETNGPPSVANAAGDTVLVFAQDRDIGDDSVTPPAGFTLLEARTNNRDVYKAAIRVAMKEGCAANENPAAWTDWTTPGTGYGVASLAISGFGRI